MKFLRLIGADGAGLVAAGFVMTGFVTFRGIVADEA
jgi:hypothetical protein